MSALIIGVPKEIKDNENRVAVQPDGVAELDYHGHQVLVETNAGTGSRFTDEEYADAGAVVAGTADEVFAGADLIVKVKEPIPAEYHRFRPGQQLFTYLHLAADRQLTERFQMVREHFDGVEQSARQGRLLREGMTVVIAGRPNAGKSSLLNRLAGYDAAIVTPIPGTTRDIVRERIDIDGMPLHVLDTAGLRKDAGDEVEAEGQSARVVPELGDGQRIEIAQRGLALAVETRQCGRSTAHDQPPHLVPNGT